MPLYEYHCESCDKSFEKIFKEQEETATCPGCGQDAFKIVSVFAAGTACTAPSGSGYG